jgi:hypothetical protein
MECLADRAAMETLAHTGLLARDTPTGCSRLPASTASLPPLTAGRPDLTKVRAFARAQPAPRT